MNEQSNDSTFEWKQGLKWAIASFLAYFILEGATAHLWGEHVTASGAAFAAALVAVVNGLTSAMFDYYHPEARLKVVHWIVVVLFATLIGGVGLVINGGAHFVSSIGGTVSINDSALFMSSTAFAGAFTLVGLPVGYAALKAWAARAIAPQGHPDNTPRN